MLCLVSLTRKLTKFSLSQMCLGRDGGCPTPPHRPARAGFLYAAPTADEQRGIANLPPIRESNSCRPRISLVLLPTTVALSWHSPAPLASCRPDIWAA